MKALKSGREFRFGSKRYRFDRSRIPDGNTRTLAFAFQDIEG
jgi:hypothetical protein